MSFFIKQKDEIKKYKKKINQGEGGFYFYFYTFLNNLNVNFLVWLFYLQFKIEH